MLPDDDVCGISVANASFLNMTDSIITGHDNDPDQIGLCVGSGSVVRGKNNTITEITHGVSLFQHGTYIGKGETIDGTIVAAEAFSSSILEFQVLKLEDDSVINSTLTGDIELGRLSLGYLRDTEGIGDVYVDTGSFVEFKNTSCGNVIVGTDSGFKSSGTGTCPAP